MRKLALLFAAILAAPLPLVSQAPAGYVLVTASRILDAHAVPANGTLTAQILNGQNPLGVSLGGGGQITNQVVTAPIINGTVTITLPDVSMTSPEDVCVAITATGNDGSALLGPGYECVQPSTVAPLDPKTGLAISNWWCSGSTCNLDNFRPAGPSTALQVQGPPGETIPGPMGCVTGLTCSLAASPQIYYCSLLKCPQDGVTPIDSVVQPILAAANSANPVVLVLDGPSFATRGLYYSNAGYATIKGLGISKTRLFILPASNQHVLRVGSAASNPTDTGVLNTQTAHAIGLEDLYIDGARGNGYSYPSGTGTAVGNGNSTTADQRGYYNGQNGQTGPSRILFDFDVADANGVYIRNVSFQNAPSYSVRFTNVSNVYVTNSRAEPFQTTETVVANNTDGFHFSGYAQNVWLDGIYCRTGDDCIPLNLGEGEGGSQTNIHISHVTLDQAQVGVRLDAPSADNGQGSPSGILSNVDISGLTGTANITAFVIGVETDHPQAHIDTLFNVHIRGVDVFSPRFMIASDSVGEMTISDSTWAGSQDAVGMIQTWHNSTFWSDLTIANCRIFRYTSGNSAGSVIDTVSMALADGSTFKHLTLQNISIEDMGTGGTTVTGGTPYETNPVSYSAIPVLNLSNHSAVLLLDTNGLSPLFSTILNVAGQTPTEPQWKHVFPYSHSILSNDLVHMAPVPDSLPISGTFFNSMDLGGAFSIIAADGNPYSVALTARPQ